MNPRIQELADQAGINCVVPAVGSLEYPSKGEIEHLKKFAELIVRECVQTLIDNSPALYTNESAEEDWDKGYDRAMEDSVQLIRKHFGVEQ